MNNSTYTRGDGVAMESSLIQPDLAYSLQQLDNLQYHH